MSLVKRGSYWFFDFIYKKKRFQGSTGVTNKNVARLIEAKVREQAALEHFGIAPPKASPISKEFLEGRFMEEVRNTSKKPRTTQFYAEHVKRLVKHRPFAELRLNQIDEEVIAAYRPRVSIATINNDLRTLSKALKLAKRWKLIHESVSVRMLPGENRRTFVVSADLETRYLTLSSYPLRESVILMLDLGLRPDECLRLKKADITEDCVIVRTGKTKNAARSIPLTDRARETIDLCCALFPESEWLFPGRKSHYSIKSLDARHIKIRREFDLPAEFVLHSCRHTFATRLEESGCHPFVMKALLGHRDIATTQLYVHVQDEGLTLAMRRMEELSKIRRGEATQDVLPDSKARI